MAESDISVSFRSLFQYPIYLRFLLYFFVLLIATCQRYSFLTGYGAAYFAGCHSIEMNNDCHRDYDYDKYNSYWSLTMSLQNGLAFITAPIIGSLSDRFGRKPFLILALITYLVPPLIMTFHNDVLLYMMLCIPFALNGSAYADTPVTQSYVADVLPQRLHILGYALKYLIFGGGVIIGQNLGSLVSNLFDDHFNFYVIAGLFALCGLYLLIMIPDTKTSKLRVRRNRFTQTFSEKAYNPSMIGSINQTQNEGKSKYNACTSLKLCCANRIIFWCSLLNGLVSFPNTGLHDIATIALADLFGAESSGAYHRVATYYMNGIGIGLVVGPIIVIPLLKRYLDDFGVFIAAIIITIVSWVSFMVVCLFQVEWVIAVSALFAGIGLTSAAPLSSILTDYSNPEEQGGSFGPMYACQGAAAMLAPVVFGAAYKYLKSIGIPSGIFGCAAVLFVITLIMSIGLKRTMNAIEKSKKSDVDFLLLNDEPDLILKYDEPNSPSTEPEAIF